MDPTKLIEQFLGPGASGSAAEMARKAKDRFLPQGVSGVPGGFAGGALGGLAAGGLLGVLLGNKKMSKMAGKVIGYGGAAAFGAVALRAWQKWQEQQSPAGAATPAAEPPRLARLAADGSAFEVALVRAMIAASNADGHIGPEEQRLIFDQINRSTLDADDKAFVLDELARPATASEIAALAGGPEQASELWLAARLAIDPDDPREQEFLRVLAAALRLPDGLVRSLESELTRQPVAAA